MNPLRLIPLVLVCFTAAASAEEPVMVLAPGKFGKALDARKTPLQVDGTDAFRGVPITVECWAKLFGKGSANVLVACDPRESGSHWELATRAGNGRLQAEFAGLSPGVVVGKTDVCDGTWHHLAVVHDGKEVALFVDGKEEARMPARPRTDARPMHGPLTIGMTLQGRQATRCDGLIDEVRITGGVREIAELPARAPALDGPTVGLWRFDSVDEPVGDPAWTPRPVEGDAPWWWKETDKDWVDDRFQRMDTGPFLNATFSYTHNGRKQHAYKGTAIRLGEEGEASILYDRCQLRMAAAWAGGHLRHSNRRFGLLNTPTPAGEVHFSTGSGPGWSDPAGKWASSHTPTAPLPREWARYRGLYTHGKRVVLSYDVDGTAVFESPWVEKADTVLAFTRSLEVAGNDQPMHLLVTAMPAPAERAVVEGVDLLVARHQGKAYAVALHPGSSSAASLDRADNEVRLTVKGRRGTERLKVLFWRGEEGELAKFASLVKSSPAPESLGPLLLGGPGRWGPPITVKGEVAADDAPYVIDTIPLPFDNPYRALLFLSGVDFLPGGDMAVSSAHGDVWLVGGVDARLEKVGWKRFATGMYQPLGLKVVGGKVHVLERGQLTRLHDLNGDGEADFYENVNNDWHVGAGEHSYDTCLETDPAGNWYFFNTGDTDTPTGGCLLRVSADGSRSEVFCTGFRHPIGLGVSPDGLVTGADQEGNWMPVTRVDVYRRGGFYGDMRAHHRPTPPTTFDGPLVWLPRAIDNSAGGQVWVPKGRFGPLEGQMLHLSYGNCRLVLILPQEVEGVEQAGGLDLGLQFLSGVARGRFGPDGNLYLVGMDGWQTAAKHDGCLQRVRYTGKKVLLPIGLAVHANGIKVSFTTELDEGAAREVGRYAVRRWNYRWSADYGSKNWSVEHPDRIGEDPVAVRGVRLLPDRRSVFLEVADLKPVMQMHLRFRLKSDAGEELSGEIYHTIHRLAKEYVP